jgi:hypothetical protein
MAGREGRERWLKIMTKKTPDGVTGADASRWNSAGLYA